MKNNFKIICPFCEKSIDLYDEMNFKDEFLDDNDTTEFNCPHCEKELEITTNAVYSFSAELVEQDEYTTDYKTKKYNPENEEWTCTHTSSSTNSTEFTDCCGCAVPTEMRCPECGAKVRCNYE